MSNHTPHVSSYLRQPDLGAFARSAHGTDGRPVSESDISKRAYERYEARGCVHGYDVQDWTDASRELTVETSGQVTNNSPSMCPSEYPS